MRTICLLNKLNYKYKIFTKPCLTNLKTAKLHYMQSVLPCV